MPTATRPPNAPSKLSSSNKLHDAAERQATLKPLTVGLSYIPYSWLWWSGLCGRNRNEARSGRRHRLGIGPQLGYIIPLGTMQAYINIKGYGEFDAQNRAHGWNTWLTVQLAPAAPSAAPPPMPTRSMYMK